MHRYKSIEWYEKQKKKYYNNNSTTKRSRKIDAIFVWSFWNGRRYRKTETDWYYTLIKFGTLKSNIKLFSKLVYVKTRMTVHVLPVRCPFKYRHRSSGIQLEESYHRFSTIVNELLNKLIMNCNETIAQFEKFENFCRRQKNQARHNNDSSCKAPTTLRKKNCSISKIDVFAPSN